MRSSDAEARTASPFTPEPEKRPWAILLVILLALVLAAWFAMRSGVGPGFWRESAAPRPAVPPSIPAAVPGPPKRDPAADAAPALPLESKERAPVRTVQKCVLQGRTTYSDGPCPEGAKAAQLVVRTDINLTQAPQAVTPAIRAPVTAYLPQAAAPETRPAQTAGTGWTCAALEKRIAELDALARQPQSAQTQDWITAQKREARDLQFRMKC